MYRLTLRQIPVPVERRLRTFARQNGQSINKAAISLLAKTLGLQKQGTGRTRDLAEFAGTLSEQDAKEFEKNTRCFEAIDEELWKQ